MKFWKVLKSLKCKKKLRKHFARGVAIHVQPLHLARPGPVRTLQWWAQQRWRGQRSQQRRHRCGLRIKMDQSGSKWIKVDQTRKTALRDGRDTERLSACFGTRCINCPSQVPAFLPKRQRRAGNSCRVCKSKEVQIWCWTFAGHLQNFSEKLVQQHEWQCPCRCHLQTQMNSSLEIMIKSVSGRCGSNSCSNYEHFMIILPSDSLTAILLHRYFECDLKCS